MMIKGENMYATKVLADGGRVTDDGTFWRLGEHEGGIVEERMGSETSQRK